MFEAGLAVCVANVPIKLFLSRRNTFEFLPHVIETEVKIIPVGWSGLYIFYQGNGQTN